MHTCLPAGRPAEPRDSPRADGDAPEAECGFDAALGDDGVGVAPAQRWRALLARARRRGAFLGLAPRKHPRDFGSFGRFHRELAALPRITPPAPLTLEELDLFLAGRREDAVSWA